MPDSEKASVSAGTQLTGYNGLIATVDAGDYARSKEEGLANARLIAAAPELLEAAKRICESDAWSHVIGNVGLSGDMRVLQNAIAKAEGKS